MSFDQRKTSRLAQNSQTIQIKANRVLNFILIAFAIIVLRIWHLAVIQHDQREEEARRPQRRHVIEAAKRGTIRDRFNLPLAINRIQYNAALLYAPLRQIPAVRLETDKEGKKTRRYKRKEYITQLAILLSEKLSLDPERLEDLIHSKGALYNQIPFIIKEDISEQEYYTLKLLEKDWPGIQVQRLPKRHYPLGNTAGDILGYLGAINRNEYEKIVQEIASLQEYMKAAELDETSPLPKGFENAKQVKSRYHELKEKSYTLTDYVGKAGIESRYEQELRGFNGKKSYYSDARGNFLRELPGAREPLSGQRILLTISSELQQYAEELLIQNEQIRETRAVLLDKSHKKFIATKKPWIKGGAIVVINPHNGELLAMASHPRCNPNDFIRCGDPEGNKIKQSNMLRWFESEGHIAEIWNQKRPMERELYNESSRQFYEEASNLTWENYLNFILPSNSPVSAALTQHITVEDAANIGSKTNIDDLTPHLEKLPFSYDKYEKTLLTDLCRIAVDKERFSPNLLKAVRKQTLSSYRQAAGHKLEIQEFVHSQAKELYHDLYFVSWRKENEKSFLKEKREEEKRNNRYAKPYIDLLDAKESEFFTAFWTQNKWHFIEMFLSGQLSDERADEKIFPYLAYFKNWHDELAQGAHRHLPWHTAYLNLQTLLSALPATERIAYLKSFRSYQELTRPLIGRYPGLRKENNKQYEKNLAAAFYPLYGFGYGRSQAYRQAATQGSIFKLVTAYEALIQKYRSLNGKILNPHQLNPLEITDTVFSRGKEIFVGYTADGQPIPRLYKRGRLPRSLTSHLGKMDLIAALETSSNPYFALLAGDVLSSPNDLANAARLFSYGAATGIDLPGEISGNIPSDLETNRTGLYSTAIGQHSLVVTPLQTSIMLSAIANGGKILKPKIVNLCIGRQRNNEEDAIICQPNFAYKKLLASVGVDFPLFLAVDESLKKNKVRKLPYQVKQFVLMPETVRDILLQGMHRVVIRSQRESIYALSQIYRNHPEAISDYIELKEELLGKSSTSESNERIDLDSNYGINMYNHVWFGGIAFEKIQKSDDEVMFVAKDRYGVPEVVVVVYLRFGGFGKEGAPLAAQMVAKWREIKQRHATETQ